MRYVKNEFLNEWPGYESRGYVEVDEQTFQNMCDSQKRCQYHFVGYAIEWTDRDGLIRNGIGYVLTPDHPTVFWADAVREERFTKVLKRIRDNRKGLLSVLNFDSRDLSPLKQEMCIYVMPGLKVALHPSFRRWMERNSVEL